MSDSSRRPQLRGLVLVSMIAAAALSRLLPHPPNFTAVGAMALFAGAHLTSRWQALAVPLIAMLVSDTVLQLAVPGWGFHTLMPVVYACVAVTAWLGSTIMRQRVTPTRAGAASLTSASIFYLVTNLGMWWSGIGAFPRTLDGLVATYIAGLPYFGNTLAGYAFFGGLLFGGWAMLERRFLVLAPAGSTV